MARIFRRDRVRVRRVVLWSIALVFLLGVVPGVGAATFTVDTTAADMGDQNLGDGVCEYSLAPPPGARCTLRAAVQEANEMGGADVIVIPPAFSIVLSNAGRLEDAAATGDLDILDHLTIQSPALPDERPVVDGAGLDRVFQIHDGVAATISDLVITGGDATDPSDFLGGGILMGSNAELNLVRSMVSGNVANSGGGIWVPFGALANITDTTFRDNTALDLGFTNADGGAMVVADGTAEVVGSTIAGNHSPFGGIWVVGGFLLLRNSTLAGNEGVALGMQNAEVELLNTTIVDSGSSGLQYFSFAGTDQLKIMNSVVASSGSNDCLFNSAGSFDIEGNHNLDSDGTCGLSAAMGDLPGTAPQLGPLQLNGGTTETQVPLFGSPLIDAGDDATCEVTDQRGESRPLDGDSIGSAVCDIGAIEVLPCVGDENLFLSSQSVSIVTEFEACYTIEAGPAFEVQSGGDVTFRVREGVVLKDGFSVHSGGTFQVVIDPTVGRDGVL